MLLGVRAARSEPRTSVRAALPSSTANTAWRSGCRALPLFLTGRGQDESPKPRVALPTDAGEAPERMVQCDPLRVVALEPIDGKQQPRNDRAA